MPQCEFMKLFRLAQLNSLMLTDKEFAKLIDHLTELPSCPECSEDLRAYMEMLSKEAQEETKEVG